MFKQPRFMSLLFDQKERDVGFSPDSLFVFTLKSENKQQTLECVCF